MTRRDFPSKAHILPKPRQLRPKPTPQPYDVMWKLQRALQPILAEGITTLRDPDTDALLQRIRARLEQWAEPHEREALLALFDEEVAR